MHRSFGTTSSRRAFGLWLLSWFRETVWCNRCIAWCHERAGAASTAGFPDKGDASWAPASQPLPVHFSSWTIVSGQATAVTVKSDLGVLVLDPVTNSHVILNWTLYVYCLSYHVLMLMLYTMFPMLYRACCRPPHFCANHGKLSHAVPVWICIIWLFWRWFCDWGNRDGVLRACQAAKGSRRLVVYQC